MKNPRRAYLLLCLLGTLLPYAQFVPWLLDHGLDLSLFFRELFDHLTSIRMLVLEMLVVLFGGIEQDTSSQPRRR